MTSLEPPLEASSAVGAQKTGKWGIIGALVAVYLVWGSTYLGMKVGLEGFPPFLMGAIRFLVGGLLLVGVLRLRGVPLPTRREWGGATCVGLLLLGIGNGLVLFAEQTVTSGMAALCVATVPLWAALFAGFWREWPTGREWIGLVIGFVGIVVLNLGGSLRASPIGAIALIVSSMSWAFGSIWSRRLIQPAGLMAPAAQMLVGGTALLLVGLGTHEHLHRAALRPTLALVYLIFAAIVGYSAYAYLLARVRPALATSNAYVNPVIAVALGAALAGERLTPTGCAGLLLILFGVLLAAFGKQRDPSPHPTPPLLGGGGLSQER